MLQFGSVNKLTSCGGNEGEKTAYKSNKVLTLSPQMDSLNVYLI